MPIKGEAHGNEIVLLTPETVSVSSEKTRSASQRSSNNPLHKILVRTPLG